ncbi:MAG: type III pantothenate kinase [Lachnospiraceae bacterium]|nr:type III pantothenate kinase [Lachnospiraceae bacterium]
MIFAIDMGNTNIVVGCFNDEAILFTERISTDAKKTELEYAVLFKTVLEIHGITPAMISGSIISSVVPQLVHIMVDAIQKITPITPVIVGPGVKNGLNIRMDNPKQLGADLVVDAVAGLQEYGAPLIIIDMGTATTISVIDAQKNYVGGMILPGVRVSVDSLVSRTSQLPRISLEAPRKSIGTNTIHCMQSGIVYGQASCLDGMVDRIEEELGYKATVVATGGLAQIITPHCKKEIILDDDLLLKGLKIIYDKNKNTDLPEGGVLC